MKTKKILFALLMLQEAFNANMKAHKYSKLSQHAYYEYAHSDASYYSDLKSVQYQNKSIAVEKTIRFIRKHKLPIKYGCNDWIVYFAYAGKQISFHTFGNFFKSLKQYSWQWSWRKNEIFPIEWERLLCW